jgi:hypothetical protein
MKKLVLVAIVLGLATPSFGGSKKPKKVKAALTCAVSMDGGARIVLDPKGKKPARIEDAINCLVVMTEARDGEAFQARLWVEYDTVGDDGKKRKVTTEPASGEVAYHADDVVPYRYRLRPTDGGSQEPHFQSCLDFTIHAQVEAPQAAGPAIKLWAGKIKVRQDCPD